MKGRTTTSQKSRLSTLVHQAVWWLTQTPKFVFHPLAVSDVTTADSYVHRTFSGH